MAEIFGAVTGGTGLISLAIQLGDSAVKLKSFYERLRDIRSTFADLAHDLTTISLTLQELERHRQRDGQNDTLLKRCAERCKEKADKIDALVDKLESRVDRFNVAGRAYAALRQPEIPKLLDEIEQAKSSIMIALQMYSLSTQSIRDEERSAQLERMRAENATVQAAILQQVQALTLTPTTSRRVGFIQADSTESQALPSPHVGTGYVQEVDVDEDDPSEREQSRQLIKRRKQRSKGLRMRVSFAAWLTGRIWDVAATRSQQSWTCSITTWNLVPEDSPIFRSCMEGDMNAVKTLISTGSASLMDVDKSGRTLLERAAACGHVDLCRFLLEETCFPDSSQILREALDLYGFLSEMSGIRVQDDRMYRLFIEGFNLDVEIDDDLKSDPLLLCSNVECVRIIKRNQLFSYESRTAGGRFQTAILVSKVVFHRYSPELLLEWACESGVTQELAEFKTSKTMTALHTAAAAMMFTIRDYHLPKSVVRLEAWIRFTQDLIKMGADVSATCRGETPLLYGLMEMHQLSTFRPKAYLRYLRCWIRTLKDAGVDLIEYGTHECSIWQPNTFCGEYWRDTQIGLICPVFGSKPTDWSIVARRTEVICTYELHFPPGSWNTFTNPCTKIIWQPDRNEVQEGHWVKTGEQLVFSDPFDIRDELENRGEVSEHFVELIQRSQDDHGPIALRASSGKSQARTRRRSISQPPITRRRKDAYWARETHEAQPWLSYHLCPLDNRWRTTCEWNYQESDENISLRACLRGFSASSVQDTDRWKYGNCLNSRRYDEL